MDSNLIVLFGPTPDHHVITYGHQLYHSNAPEELVNLLAKNEDYDPMRMGWISYVTARACRPQ